MTAALAVLLAVLAAALGLPHSTNTAVPTPIGVGLRYTLAPGPPRAGLRDPCLAGRTARFATHVELFARGRAMLLPVGIGSAPGCRHSLWTSEPTGVIHVGAGTATLGRLFAIWGQPLTSHRLAGFRSRRPVRVYLDGRRVAESPGRRAAASARRGRRRAWPVYPAASVLSLPGGHMKRLVALGAAVITLVAAGCGSGGASPAPPSIAPALQYSLGGFRPAAAKVGRPTTIAFTVIQPDGKPLTHYRTGPGPHTGVHLILVRDDLNTIIHKHPPISKTGRVRETVKFTEPGPYRVLIDIYPASKGPGYKNLQLTQNVRVAGKYTPEPLPPFSHTVVDDGYRFTMGKVPKLHVAEASLVKVTVTDPDGHPAVFTPWFGALAHAIFFHKSDLAYFHTHVCAPGLAGCTSIVGGSTISGTSAAPGVLHVGVLLPEAGIWRLFLQCQVDGKILTAPFTLTVR